jgi:putative transposase
VILGLVDSAVCEGARQERVCEVLGIDPRALQRWRKQGIGDDLRAGPKMSPKNKLSDSERDQVIAIANSPNYRDLSPKQIVPLLAEQGEYVASESTFYRVLKELGQNKHRSAAAPATNSKPRELKATAPNQVWSWDITYLKSPLRGVFFYLYCIIDIFSRKIVGWAVELEESGEHGARLIARACELEGIQQSQLDLHQDNGAPMKSGTFLAFLEGLGVAASFSRPGVSDDNPFSEALFKTFKYRPEYPDSPFSSIEHASAFVAEFVDWYNHEHKHSAIRFVTPGERHSGRDNDVLAKRRATYERAKARRPERWTGKTRNWSYIEEVVLNPDSKSGRKRIKEGAA